MEYPYYLMGLEVRSDVEFNVEEGRPNAPIGSVVVRHVACDRLPPLPGGARRLTQSPYTIDGEPLFVICETEGALLVHVSRTAQYRIEGDRVTCAYDKGAMHYELERYLTNLVLPVHLLSCGTFCLHASAVSIDGQAVAFIASSTGGKSTLLSHLAARGHEIITDDVLPLTLEEGGAVAHPGFPRIKMWPDAADAFAGGSASLSMADPKLHRRDSRIDKRIVDPGQVQGRVCQEPVPLRRLYVPCRVEGDHTEQAVGIEERTGFNAFESVLRNTILPSSVQALGRAGDHFAFASLLVNHVGVRALRYRSGFDLLDGVAEALYRDLQTEDALGLLERGREETAARAGGWSV